LSGHLVQEIPQTHGAFEPSHRGLSSDSRSTWWAIQHDNPISLDFFIADLVQGMLQVVDVQEQDALQLQLLPHAQPGAVFLDLAVDGG